MLTNENETENETEGRRETVGVSDAVACHESQTADWAKSTSCLPRLVVVGSVQSQVVQVDGADEQDTNDPSCSLKPLRCLSVQPKVGACSFGDGVGAC
jgi:hypothetical protein